MFRSRRQLAQAGILGAAGIIERWWLTRELRLGVAQIEIEIETEWKQTARERGHAQ